MLGYPAIAKDIFMLSKESRSYDTTHLVEMFTKYSTDEFVTENTPPTFIMETDDDTTTWAEHSVRYYLALRKCGVSGELHIFKQGKHGYGLGNTRKQVYQWQQLFVKWLEVLDNN